MQKNGEYEGTVFSLGTEGEGIIKLEGITAFVPFCLEGERVSFKALKISGGVAYGKLTGVLQPAKDRVKPVCLQYERCGGCQLQHASYTAQLAFKRSLVKNALKKIAGLDVEVSQTVSGGKQYAYRNKLALPVGILNGQTVVGFYAPRSHRIVPIDNCPLQREWNGALINAFRKFLLESGYVGYDEATKKGDIRQLVARDVGGKMIITVVCAREISLNAFTQALKGVFEEFTLWQNINASTGNVIFGDKWKLVCGDGAFGGEDCGIKFTAGAKTFLQVNDGVRTLLYQDVIKAVKSGGEVAIDLYSGGGMLTAMLAKACGVAYGIEIVPEAVECANELKRQNALEGKMFNLCGAVEDRIGEVLKKSEGLKRVIVCDPPRKGMERSVCRAIAASGAERVVLISCNPATLARDLGLLCGTLIEEDGALVKGKGNGAYEIVSVTPYDMFPQTKHCETLVTLSLAKG